MLRQIYCNELNGLYSFESAKVSLKTLVDSKRLETESTDSNVLYALQKAKAIDDSWNDATGMDALCVVDGEHFLAQLCLIITANELGWSYGAGQCTTSWFPFRLLKFNFAVAVQHGPVIQSSYERKIKRILQLIALFIAAGYRICDCQTSLTHPPGLFLAEMFVSFDFSHLLDFFVKAKVPLAQHTYSLQHLDEPERLSRVKVIREKERPQVASLSLLASYVVRANLRTNAFAATRALLDQQMIPVDASEAITLGISKKTLKLLIS